jgi:hypothetical protein
LQRPARYYLRQNWRKWAIEALEKPLRVEEEPDGRIRRWICVPELHRHLRVVFLEDGETLHNMMKNNI